MTEALIAAAEKHADNYEGDIPARDVRACIQNAFFAGAEWNRRASLPAVPPLSDAQTEAAMNANGLAWAVSQWQAEVSQRPLVNVHRRSLDDTWRQVVRYFGGDPDKLLGPSHDELRSRLTTNEYALLCAQPQDSDLLRQALDALELHGKQYPHMVKGYCVDAIAALRARLEAAP